MRKKVEPDKLRHHMMVQGIDWPLFVKMAEANWDGQKYKGIRAMSRILGTSDTSLIKYLKLYDERIGRQRHASTKK
jgi:hypothetical protein